MRSATSCTFCFRNDRRRAGGGHKFRTGKPAAAATGDVVAHRMLWHAATKTPFRHCVLHSYGPIAPASARRAASPQ